MKSLKCYILVLFFFAAYLGHSQTIDDLKNRKEKTEKEIRYTTKLLEETGKNTKVSLNKLSVLNQQIGLRKKLIDDYNAEINILEASISDNNYVVESLSKDIEILREEYSLLIKEAYKNRHTHNPIIFLLSSENFNQAYKRLLYTRQLAGFRKRQAEQIVAVKEVLEDKITDLDQRRSDKEAVLSSKLDELDRLSSEKQQQSSYYSNLKKRQRELKKHLRYQQKIEKRLEKAIEKMIEEEARKAKEKAMTPEEQLVSDNFEKNRGKFPWPVAQGIITDRFGEHAHPVMSNIIIRNNGIDITTRKGEKARSVFKGNVSRIFAIPGGNMAVIVRHGEYITVYSNLKDVMVKQGDKVETKQPIGTIFTDEMETKKTVLKFQLWKENIKQDPEIWLAK